MIEFADLKTGCLDARICVLKFSEGREVVLKGGDVPSPDDIVRFFKRRREKRRRDPGVLAEMKQRLSALRKARHERTR
ncbi:hypothetical protein [Bradyrhizobium elkanii]|uniref:hypothetical protein n=1 Tax=Bradyrhizobium elkanii TaxID=29448 RepID=UPI00144998B4|nr:hypothetical protein [Bradyrhizobium elkanii]MCS3577763.1 hypothetical protein [Bradyrhizobium elkanii]MCS3720638.1 hypothetical protein [Bradyrhizobium elkanii]MCS4005055.1 hypothetical protein [Bradyrhizobium elkanii USDA 61]MCW2130319.1 hypothetical protein [Bradyrhizobium elkanii]MCW2167995.1 hypothetical protein [Bradyrhizobium elkanii]